MAISSAARSGSTSSWQARRDRIQAATLASDDPGVASTARTPSVRPMRSRPGWIANAATPCRRTSTARFSVNLITAALETA